GWRRSLEGPGRLARLAALHGGHPAFAAELRAATLATAASDESNGHARRVPAAGVDPRPGRAIQGDRRLQALASRGVTPSRRPLPNSAQLAAQRGTRRRGPETLQYE